MKSSILILCLLFSFTVLAQTEPLEAEWKTRGRNLVSRLVGEKWGTKLFGPVPVVEEPVKMPEIPSIIKKSTDIGSYTKIQKDPTEYDRLPADQKRKFDYKFVLELFQVTRKSDPKDEDLSNWLNTLDQGGSREGIYQGLVLDEVYAALENIDEKPSKRLLEFTLAFSQKFLNQTFKESAIDQLNCYSLKRIVSERFLDVMEYYETKDLDALYRWYAVLSSDLAKQYSPMMKSPLRLDPNPEYHYEWAKSMPLQHIKSEVIIKVHMVMNGLQLLP